MDNTSTKRLNICLSSFACQPGLGSEEGMGWDYVKHLSKHHNLWVIVRTKYREPILAHLEKHPHPNITWIFFDFPKWTLLQRASIQLSYHLWQFAIYNIVRDLCVKEKIDIIHHVTYAKYWTPSVIANIDVPFIWGPVGGGESMPTHFYNSLSFKGRLYERIRDIGRKIGDMDPFVKRTAKRSVIGFATSDQTAIKMSQAGAKNVQIMSSMALSEDDKVVLNALAEKKSGTFRLISMGRLLDWKGFHLSIKAFAQFNKQYPDSEYWIFGEGPRRPELEQLLVDLNLQDKVTIWGYVSRDKLLKHLEVCDALIHPSLHDSGGWVCVEAMAARRPVICLDIGGPRLMITDEVGYKIGVADSDQAIADMSDAMLKLANNTELKLRMGQAAKVRIDEHFSWDKKIDYLNEVYFKILHAQKNPKILPEAEFI